MSDEVTVTQQRDDTLTAAMDNVLAMRLGQVARETGRRTYGDFIDYGLALNSELNKAGFALVKTSDDHLFIGQHPRHRTSTAVPNGVVEAMRTAGDQLDTDKSTFEHLLADRSKIDDGELEAAIANCNHATSAIDEALITLQQSAPAAAGDVVRLVIAARHVAFEDQGPEAIKELDKASEAFASVVPWENEDEA